MDDLEKIRQRIAKRHHGVNQKKVLGDKQFNRLYRFSIVTMGLCVLCLGMATYVKQNPASVQFLNNHMNFSEVGQWVERYVLNVIPFFNQSTNSDEMNAVIQYEALGNHQYQAINHEICSIESGIVTSLSNTGVVVSQDNGVTASFDGFSEIKVALYDHVSKGELLGKCENQFSMKLTKDGQEIAYENENTIR